MKIAYMVRVIRAVLPNRLRRQHQKAPVSNIVLKEFILRNMQLLYQMFVFKLETTDRTSSSAPSSDTTKTLEDLSTTNRESVSFGTTSEIGTTNYGTSTSVSTTSQSTTAVTRPETTWPSSSSTHHITSPVTETTHYHKTSTTEMDNNILDHTREDVR